MAEFTKTYCDLHPHELITNFCINQQCLVGLCANCICTHTQSHVEKGTSPVYENIRTTCTKMRHNIQSQIELLDKDKQRIMAICDKVQEKRHKLNQLVDMAKQEAIAAIGILIEDRRTKMLREIEAQEKQAGLHCESRLNSLLSTVSRQSSNLIYAIQDLNSANFIESLPRIRTQTLANAKSFHEQLTFQIQQNEIFKTCISFHKSALQNLNAVVNNLITINFSLNGRQTFIKAEYNQLATSRASSKGLAENLRSMNKNPSIALNLQDNSLKKQNAQSQISFNQHQQRCSYKSLEKQNSHKNLYQTQPPHTFQNVSHQLLQTKPVFGYPKFLSEVPQSSNINPYCQESQGLSRNHPGKVSMSKVSRISQEPTKTQNINIGTKLRKNGLTLMQVHQSETQNYRDLSEIGKNSRKNFV